MREAKKELMSETICWTNEFHERRPPRQLSFTSFIILFFIPFTSLREKQIQFNLTNGGAISAIR